MLVMSKEQMQNADMYCIKKLGILEEILMENAGQAFLEALKKELKLGDRIIIFCGCGNNGGDGIVLARRLKQNGFNVRLIFVDGINNFSKAAAYHFRIYCNFGFDYELFSLNDISLFNEVDFIVDAIFGTGFHGEPEAKKAEIFEHINKSKAKVVALDVPSGVSVNEGYFKKAVKADFTFSVSYLKRSAFLFPAKLNYGKVCVVDAGIVCSSDMGKVCMRTWGVDDFRRTFVFEESSANKWSRGSALIIGGSRNMVGAVILAAKACLNSGIGLLKMAVPNSLKRVVVSNVFEATYVDVEEKDGVLADFEFSGRLNVVAVGPGLSRCGVVKNVVYKVIGINVPIVLDADALSFLSVEVLKLIKNREFFTVLTPHEKEMSRLCGCSLDIVRRRRFDLAKEKAVEWNCFLVLKGPNTVITTPSGLQFVNLSGNEGLAKGGTGDVLTGIIAAMVARCLNLNDENEIAQAICNAVFVHGYCSDLLVNGEKDAVSITATDLLNGFGKTFKKLRGGSSSVV